jgi:hypothetical protein
MGKQSLITAGLNPKNEHIQYLHANHREICKFLDRSDSNYIVFKNALGTAVENLIKAGKVIHTVGLPYLTRDESCYDKRSDF